jgi:hypothetical protein
MIYNLWVLAHVVCFVVWLGTDLGVFYLSRRLLDTKLEMSGRAALARAMSGLDMGARTAIVVIPATGIELLSYSHGPVTGLWLLAVWAGDLGWLGLVWWLHYHNRSDVSVKRGWTDVMGLDMALRVLIPLVLIGSAIASFVTSAPFGARWIALKVGLYAICVLAGLGIRVTLGPFSQAFTRTVQDGSTPEGELTMRLALRKTTVFVWTIWLAILGAAFLGIAQPALGGR